MKSENMLHVVSFDVPYPANYGGVMDIYYKLVALKNQGFKITLHTYEYGRGRPKELEEICYAVFYYKRRMLKNPFYSQQPYIVVTRNTQELLDRLLQDQNPILFEGLHCCYYLNHPELKARFKIVRTHNIEHDYYKKLEESENSFFKKYFFRIESERLKKFEPILKYANLIAAISPADTEYFKKKYHDKVMYLPAFHPNKEVKSNVGKGDFVFYHGNLSVGENDLAARFLVNEVYSNPALPPLIIAGKSPSSELLKAASGKKNIRIISQLNSAEMLEYIQNAHINLLPTFQSTGIKLKLINALFLGRFCVVNPDMVHKTGLELHCHISKNAEEMQQSILKLWDQPFDQINLEQRRKLNESAFSTTETIRKLIDRLILQTSLVG